TGLGSPSTGLYGRKAHSFSSSHARPVGKWLSSALAAPGRTRLSQSSVFVQSHAVKQIAPKNKDLRQDIGSFVSEGVCASAPVTPILQSVMPHSVTSIYFCHAVPMP